MNAIDPRTVILISGVMGGLMSMVLFFMHRSYPVSIAGLREWAWSLAILFLAGVLASLGGMASPWLANIAPNALICCGMYLAFVGSRRFFGQAVRHAGHSVRTVETLGWTDCGCSADGTHWRNGLVLDPFGGSGTTAVAATGLGRDAILIDIDARNAELARDRVGMFLEVEG